MIRYHVKGIALDKKTKMPLLLLKNSLEESLIPLPVGPSEASAIIVELENVHPPRPLTHDLLVQFFIRHKFRLRKVEVYSRLDDKFLARLIYTKGLSRFSMEVRPSDGIALALRLDAGIFLDPGLWTENTREFFLDDFDTAGSEILFLDDGSIHRNLM